MTTVRPMRRALIAQQQARPEQHADLSFHIDGEITRQYSNSVHAWTRGIRDTFEFVAVASSHTMSSPQHPNRSLELANFHLYLFSRLLLYP